MHSDACVNRCTVADYALKSCAHICFSNCNLFLLPNRPYRPAPAFSSGGPSDVVVWRESLGIIGARELLQVSFFVATKDVFCRHKSMLVATKLLSRHYICRDKTFVATKLFVATDICRNKSFVVKKIF